MCGGDFFNAQMMTFAVFALVLRNSATGHTAPHANCIADAANLSTVTGCLAQAMPQWVGDAGEFSCHALGGGLTNHLFHCEPGDGAAEGRELLFRVYGVGSGDMVNRVQETRVLVNLAQLGFPSGLHATFTNGRIERFLQGRTLSPEEMRMPRFARLIAQRLYQLHQLDMPGVSEAQSRQPGLRDDDVSLWPNLDKFLGLVEAALKSSKLEALPAEIGLVRVREAIAKLRGSIEAIGARVTFTHGDLQCLNMLFEEPPQSSPVVEVQEGVLILIDFEYSGYNYRAFDIANHLTEWMGYGPIDWAQLPGERAQREFISLYVAASGLVETDVEAARALEKALFMELQILSPAPHLFWGLWALVQLSISDIDFDWETYAHERLRYACTLLLRDHAEEL